MPNSPDFDQLTSKEMQQINDACDQFESAWRQWQSGNEVPSITSAMTENQTSDQPSVTFRAAQCWALIEVDREARQEHGLPAERQDYLIVLPADLHHVLAHVDFAARSAPAGDPSEEPRGIRYRVVDTHARGGLGEVFIARDQELGRDVALKEIRGEYADDPDCRNRFLLEAEVTGSLEHPGIVPVYGLGRYEDGRPYYAMRFIKGQSLREVVNEFHGQSASEETGPQRTVSDYRGLEFRKLLNRFIDVCEAIEYAHSRGVLHRDLKPSNIMLGEFGETLVVDWGLAKLDFINLESDGKTSARIRPGSGSGSTPTLAGTAIGTPAYMSPEQAAGRLEDMGPQSDVYGLGATLYYMLTCQPPISGTSTDDIIKNVKSGRIAPPCDIRPEIPKALQSICLHAMSQVPSERYASAKAIGNEIERWLADEPVEVHAESVLQRLRRGTRRHPVVATVTASLLLFGGIAAFTLQEFSHSKEAASHAEQVAAEQSVLVIQILEDLTQVTQFEYQKLPAMGDTRRKFLEITLRNLDKVSDRYVETDRTDRRFALTLMQLGELAMVFPQSNGVETSDSSVNRDQVEKSPVQLAAKYFERADRIASRLVGGAPADIECQRIVALAKLRLGDARFFTGELSGAIALYQESAEYLENVLNLSSNEYDVVRLSHAFQRMGEANLKSFDPVAAINALEKSTSVFVKVSEAQRSQPRIQKKICEARQALGRAYLEVGQTSKAMSEFEASVASLRKLHKELPELVAGADVARALSLMIVVHVANKKLDKAIELQVEAIALAESDPDKDSRNVQREIARGYFGFGQLNLEMGNSDKAVDPLVRSLEIHERLAEEDPANEESQSDLHSSIGQFGKLKLSDELYNRVTSRLQQMLDVYTALLNLEPENHRLARHRVYLLLSLADLADTNEGLLRGLSYRKSAESQLSQLLKEYDDVILQNELGNVLETLGVQSQQLGDAKNALLMHSRSLNLRKLVSQSKPNTPASHRGVFVSHYNVGLARLHLHEFSAAAQSFREGVTVATNALDHSLNWHGSELETKMVTMYALSTEALVCTEQKNFKEAATKAKEVMLLPHANAECLGFVACVFGRCLSAQGSPDSEAPDKQIYRRELTDSAISALRAAIANDFSKPALYNDEDLQSLRGNPQFEALFNDDVTIPE